MSAIPARLGVLQRVLPNYRAPFFNALGQACAAGLSVFAGQPGPHEAIEITDQLPQAHFAPGRNLHLFSGRFYLCLQTGLLGWLQTWDPAVLIVEANPRYLRTPAAVRWMQRRGRRVIGWGLGAPNVGVGAGPLRNALRRRFLQQFDALITYSQQGRTEYLHLGFNPGRVFVAPNAAAPRPISPPPIRSVGFHQGRPTILSVGRLQLRKRLDLLIEACALFPPESRPRLWIVGDGPARPALEALAAARCPEAQFFGARFGDTLNPLYQQADLFVLPGTGGLAVQQAMAHGLPVVVAEADGTQADLVRPENGILTRPGDLQQLHRALQTALENPARLRRMGEASFHIVNDEINLEAMVAAFSRAIASVLEA